GEVADDLVIRVKIAERTARTREVPHLPDIGVEDRRGELLGALRQCTLLRLVGVGRIARARLCEVGREVRLARTLLTLLRQPRRTDVVAGEVTHDFPTMATEI